MGEKEEWKGSCAMEGGATEKAKVVRNRLMWVACAATWSHGDILA